MEWAGHQYWNGQTDASSSRVCHCKLPGTAQQLYIHIKGMVLRYAGPQGEEKVSCSPPRFVVSLKQKGKININGADIPLSYLELEASNTLCYPSGMFHSTHPSMWPSGISWHSPSPCWMLFNKHCPLEQWLQLWSSSVVITNNQCVFLVQNLGKMPHLMYQFRRWCCASQQSQRSYHLAVLEKVSHLLCIINIKANSIPYLGVSVIASLDKSLRAGGNWIVWSLNWGQSWSFNLAPSHMTAPGRTSDGHFCKNPSSMVMACSPRNDIQI